MAVSIQSCIGAITDICEERVRSDSGGGSWENAELNADTQDVIAENALNSPGLASFRSLLAELETRNSRYKEESEQAGSTLSKHKISSINMKEKVEEENLTVTAILREYPRVKEGL